ncbi:hypothetical protein ATY30_13655 [Sinorhizobium americanum]|uniref:Uncharacterized protein n=2 Tax=Sinorhizobium/Ensifer group TaxID=227292 RepID=A0A2S3YQ91_9HYPH|nr:hypothetical protein CO656_27840 [Sinorhizobium sp. FG01]PDT48317.1 hypothetical protein CO664_29030 [Sinorhizobium sp. NG07B]POH29957.1 hypothetical protein ATY30_13655 [Sinorhizobium americanum]POH33209.1 hypothetical protein ATY31_11160 [Sinorhizobium americanum]
MFMARWITLGMEAAGALPAIAIAEDGARAGAGEFIAQEVKRRIPIQRNTFIKSVPFVPARALLQPPLGHHGVHDARALMQRSGKVADDIHRIRVAGMTQLSIVPSC